MNKPKVEKDKKIIKYKRKTYHMRYASQELCLIGVEDKEEGDTLIYFPKGVKGANDNCIIVTFEQMVQLLKAL